ncbi:MAG: ferrous iron transport protein B [Phycisphaerae bacterium]|nr:ferrous iron transport protein B [Phycisphaerae bacterium]
MRHRKTPVDHPLWTIALAGNPNAGKTTIFNALTGARQHVGNYPGVTVEKRTGVCQRGGRPIRVVDLPGTYSLTAYSTEERIAREFVIAERPDVVVDVVDASNLERNLYLAVQLMELGVPLVLALNMWDVASGRGMELDLALLESRLGVPVVPTVGHTGQGMDGLLEMVLAVAGGERTAQPGSIRYGEVIERHLDALQASMERSAPHLNGVPRRWTALKLLEGDEVVRNEVGCADVLSEAAVAVSRLEAVLGDSPESRIAERRYAFISGVCQEAVCSAVEPRRSRSDRIDAIVANRVLGLPIFLGLMYLVFHLTFTVGGPPMGWIEAGFSRLGVAIGGLWPAGSESVLRSLLVDGIIGGVGGVLVFLPNILLLFLAIAVLEDSGYMARAAFLMDRLMRKMGLHGKSFVPMLIGFGCSVPAIMATRTLENRRDRLATMLVVPLMSCGARLPIYALMIPAFFPPAWHAPMLWLIYLIGVVLAVACAKLLRITVLRGEAPPFVMELPPYRRPTLKSVTLHMWNRGGAYLKKAGTIILGIAILLWTMQQWPELSAARQRQFAAERAAARADACLPEETRETRLAAIDNAEAQAALEASLMGRIGRGLEPVLRPCGFDWKVSTSLIGAFAAKEVFVAQLGIVYSLGEEHGEASAQLREKLQADYTPLQGFCIMLFCLISAPCMATVAVTRRESNSWGWALLQLGGLTALAWIVTTAVYQTGSRVF